MVTTVLNSRHDRVSFTIKSFSTLNHCNRIDGWFLGLDRHCIIRVVNEAKSHTKTHWTVAILLPRQCEQWISALH